MYHCPNCAFDVLRDALKCPRCDANFGPGSSWRPTRRLPRDPAVMIRGSWPSDATASDRNKTQPDTIVQTIGKLLLVFGYGAALLATSFLAFDGDMLIFALIPILLILLLVVAIGHLMARKSRSPIDSNTQRESERS
jgi:peptidoglycan/LPS O-acetylase OafA/YrhL